MGLSFELAGSQIDGARDYQEDAFLITNLADNEGNPSALVVVADGMGGHAAGNVASNMAVQAFNKQVSANYPSENISEILHESVLKANHSITETIKETPALQGMGCTMVAAILEKGQIWWASVGDSHLYLIRGKELIKLNADHSYGGFLDRMEEAGTPVEPEAGLSRNMLMSAITGDEINEIDCPSEPTPMEPGDKILICSDGLDTLSSGKIIQFSDWSESPKDCADALLKAVEEAAMPRQDNTTVVVVNVKEGAAAEEAAAPAQPEEPGIEEIEVTADHPVTEPPDDLALESSVEPAPQPGPAAPGSEETAPAQAKKSPVGLIAGIVVVVLLVAGGGYFMLAGGDKQAPAPEVTVTEPETETEVIEEMETDEPEAEMETEPAESEVAEEVAEEVPAEPAAKTADEPEPTVKETAPPGNEFQDTLKSGGKGPMMVVINAGSFQMGSSGSTRFTDERPRHKVSLKKYAFSKYEVTFAEYEKFAKAEGRKIPDNLYLDKTTHPVIFVSWDDAYYYAKWLSEQTGHEYSLPSEAQWEYAASAGKTTTFWWGYEEKPGMAHCFGCGSGFDPRKPTKIGSFSANGFGIHDTAGNVAEWVQDCWHEDYNGAPDDGSVWEGGDCSYRVVRGGSYSSPPASIRSQKRDKFKSEKLYDHIGIRLVREIE